MNTLEPLKRRERTRTCRSTLAVGSHAIGGDLARPVFQFLLFLHHQPSLLILPMSKTSVPDPPTTAGDVGSDDTRHTQPAAQRASTSGPSSSAATDTAQSLRDVALRTLKAKRKRSPGHTQNLPTAPSRMRPTANIAPPSIQLDYGNNESTTIPLKPPAHPTKTTPTPQPSPVVDPTSREEGEISDSETTPTVPAKQLDPPLNPTARPFHPSRPITPAKPPTPKMTRDVKVATEVAGVKPELTSPIIAMDISVPPLPTPTRSTPEIPGLSVPHYVVDANHVRPGLSRSSTFHPFIPSEPLCLHRPK